MGLDKLYGKIPCEQLEEYCHLVVARHPPAVLERAVVFNAIKPEKKVIFTIDQSIQGYLRWNELPVVVRVWRAIDDPGIVVENKAKRGVRNEPSWFVELLTSDWMHMREYSSGCSLALYFPTLPLH